MSKKKEFEVIIINNGSTDNSKVVLEENKYKLKNLNVININNNVGFGNGIKKGIMATKNKVVCYTHGDLQIKIENCLKAYEIYENSQDKKIFVKSKRKGRGIVSSIFTILMSIFNSVFFKCLIYDIHSQPNLFEKPCPNIVENCPNDMGIDLYFYLYFKKKGFLIRKYKVYFEKRIYGIGNNDFLIDKIKYSFKSIRNSLEIRKKINEIFKNFKT